jgi:hypothetical protein
MFPSWKQALLPTFLCLLVGGSLSLGACSLTSDAPPVADSTFSRVLVDIHLLSARKHQSAPLPRGLNDSLLAHHGIEREEFNATLRYYAHHPDVLTSLYNGVIDTLKAISNRRRYDPTSSPGIPDSVREQMPE